MKNLATIIVTLALVVAASCGGGTGDSGGRKKAGNEPDTGYTGVKNYIRNDIKVREVTFSNGIREGMTRTFYMGGVVEQEIPYEGGKKNGLAKWFYPDAKLFRVTPYVNDTISGTQIQYYKNGNVKAKLEYVDGKRKPGLEEYNMDGSMVTGYPEVTYRTEDLYRDKGLYKVFVEMSDMSENVKYYRGDLEHGLVDIDSVTPLLQTATTGYLDLKKTPDHRADSVVIIAGYLTKFGNRLYYRKAIALPYKDLN